jgi:hypothetical protein
MFSTAASLAWANQRFVMSVGSPFDVRRRLFLLRLQVKLGTSNHVIDHTVDELTGQESILLARLVWAPSHGTWALLR